MDKHDDVIAVRNELFFMPYNTINHEISLNQVQTILTTYGVLVKLNDISIYKTAFVHRSYCNRQFDKMVHIAPCPDGIIPLQSTTNERLEFLGDGILECVTKYYMYRRFQRENEGFMTEKKIALVKNEAIGSLVLNMGLQEWYIISKHSEEKNMRTNLKKLGCLFEAFIGAIFIDLGFHATQTFIESVFETHVDWTELILCNDNYKNILQVKIQKEFKTTPDYAEISQQDAYHSGVYLCLGQSMWNTSVSKALPFTQFGTFQAIHTYMKQHPAVLILLGEGHHKIKKKSEQVACEQALKIISGQKGLDTK